MDTARRGRRVPARRDRRGRGMRGRLVPPTVPLSRSRAEQFDDLVLDAVEHLEERWAEQLQGVEFAVEDVPPVPAGGGSDLDTLDLGEDVVADDSRSRTGATAGSPRAGSRCCPSTC